MKLKQDYLALPSAARRAFWLILALALGLFIISVYIFPALRGASWWAPALTNSIPLVVGIGSVVSAWFILKGRLAFAGTLFISIISTGMTLVAVSLDGLAFLLIAIVFITSTYVASLVYSKNQFTWMPIASLVVCAMILLVDTYAFWERDWISNRDSQFTLAIAAAILILYLFFALRQFRELSLGTKLVFVSLSLVILPILLVGSMGYQSSRMALETNANQALLSSASQIATRYDAFILDNLDTLRTEASLTNFRELLEMPAIKRPGSSAESHVAEMLLSLRLRDPIFIASYMLLDRGGNDIADTNPQAVGLSHATFGYFQKPMQTGIPYVSPILVSITDQEKTIYFSAPVRNQYGEIVGVLCAGFYAQILQQQLIVQEVLRENEAYSLLVDEYSFIRANSLDPDLIHKSIAPLDEAQMVSFRGRRVIPEGIPQSEIVVELPQLVAGLSGAEQRPNFSGIFQRTIKNTGNPEEPLEQAGAVKMDTQSWYVVMVQPRTQLLAPVERLARGTVVLGVIAALVGAFFATLVAQYFSNRIVRLTDAASQIALGNLSVQAEIISGDELGTLATAFNLMSRQLSGLVGTLEQRVVERTRALTASAEVSRRLSTLLDVDQLVRTVVDQLQDAFHYYHVHIYLFDESGEKLVMVGGTGDAGRVMLAKGHSLPRGKGLVGQAAETMAPVLVEDVSKAPEWLPNPLLPMTRAELAVPILIGDTVLGVLDVQQDQVCGLSQLDADLIQSIANQVAIALSNARSYAQAQRRANREAMISAIAQRIQRTASTEDALRVAAREIGRALGAETSVSLGAGWEERRVKKSNSG